jgi:transposase
VVDDELLAVVLPHLGDVVVDAVSVRARILQIEARTRALEAGCPECGVLSRRVHGRYVRRLSDAGVAGREVEILLTVRRFTCCEAGCGRRTFVEQVPSLTGRYQRRTGLLRAVLESIAVMLAGRAGARLAQRLSVTVSRSSLLRLLGAVAEPTVGDLTAIGIDDFALRRGHVYGTVVIDMDTHKPVDVLPDRSAATVEAWLSAHPGIEIICRDRAGAYAEGARAGAPTAVQVADRWHLYKNLAEAVEKVVARYRHDLDEPDDPTPADLPPAGDCAETAAPEKLPDETSDHDEPPPSAGTSPGSQAGRIVTRTIERHQAVHALLDAGRSRIQISKELGLDPHTVRRYAATTDVSVLINPRRTYATILDGFKAHLHQRWNEGVTDAAQLYREISARGYEGSCKSVRRYLHPLRAALSTPAPRPTSPTIRDVTGWLTRRPEDLSRHDTTALASLLNRNSALASTYALVRGFAQMLTNLTGQHLPAWLNRVEHDGEPELRTFARGVHRDLAAVTAGLTLPYSSGPVEGNVNRIKMIKRQMYGRAGFALLRHRILLRA